MNLFWKMLSVLFVIALFLAVGVFASLLRWEISAVTKDAVFRLDRWTGSVVRCGVSRLEVAMAEEAQRKGAPLAKLKMNC